MRKRTARRAQDRALTKLARDKERLFQLGPGGSAERPIVVVSPAEVEGAARSLRCPICDGELKVEEHTAETIGTARLRVAKVICGVCRARRAIYFQLASARLN